MTATDPQRRRYTRSSRRVTAPRVAARSAPCDGSPMIVDKPFKHFVALGVFSAALGFLLASNQGCGRSKSDSSAATDPASTAPPPTAPGSTAGSASNAATEPKAPAPPTGTPVAAVALPADPGDSTGLPQWAIGYGGVGTDAGRSIAVDSSGAIYVGGYFEGESNFGVGPTVTAAELDAYLLKLEPTGKPSWVLTFGGDHQDVVNAVATKADGAVVIAGLYAGEIKIGDIELRTAGSDDAFVAQVDKDGRTEWALAFGGTDSDGANHVAVGPLGHIAVTGSFGRSLRVGKTELKSVGGEDMFVFVISPQGEISWARSFGAYNKDVGERVAFDAQGNLFLLGEFTDSVDFGTAAPLESAGNRDIALVKFDAAGKTLSAKRFGSAFNELALGMALDPAGNLAITGSFDHQITIGGDVLKSAGESDVFVASFSADGNLRWTRRYGGPREDIGAGVTMDKFGNTLLVGWFWGEIQASPQALLKSAGNKDGFVLKLSPEGALVWSHRMGGTDHDQARAVAVDQEGAVLVVGIFRFDVAIGESKLSSAHGKGERAPKSDVFIARFAR